MQTNRVRYRVQMDNGNTLTVDADQRDFAAVEAQPIAPEAHYTRGRFMVWNAMRRGGYPGSWEKFNAHDCVQIEIEETEASEDPNRGRPEADAGQLSTSPSDSASR